jgi:hypothetical protein
MKKTIPLVFLLSVMAFNASAAELGFDTDQSTDDPDSESPCVVVTCLYGKLTGNAQSECSSAEKFFKNIKATKKHGIFDPTKTLRKRTQFVNGCPSADKESKDMVLKAFGKLKSF